MANLGAGLLDALQGVNISNNMLDQREDRARTVKRNAMADEVAQAGLEDFRRTRAGDAADRAAFAAAPDQATGLSAVKSARQARGDVAGSVAAGKSELDLQVDDFKRTSLEYEKKMLPIEQKIKAGKLKFEADSQPGLQALQGQQLQDALGNAQEQLIWKAWNIAKRDTGVAAQLLSDSKALYPGKKVGGITLSEDGKAVIVLDERGQPLSQINRSYLESLDQKFAPPSKFETVKPGERLVRTDARGNAVEAYAAPDKPDHEQFAPLPQDSPGLFNRRTGAITPAPGGGAMSPQRRDARFKIAEQVIGNALGGSFDAIGKLSLKPGTEAVYQRASVLAEEAIKAGMDPAQAASKAVDQALRESKTGGAATGAPGLPTSSSINWQEFAPKQ